MPRAQQRCYMREVTVSLMILALTDLRMCYVFTHLLARDFGKALLSEPQLWALVCQFTELNSQKHFEILPNENRELFLQRHEQRRLYTGLYESQRIFSQRQGKISGLLSAPLPRLWYPSAELLKKNNRNALGYITVEFKVATINRHLKLGDQESVILSESIDKNDIKEIKHFQH